MNSTDKRPLRQYGRRRGATTLEYAVLVGVLLGGTVGGAMLLGGGVNDTMNSVDSGSAGTGAATPGSGGSASQPTGSGDAATGGSGNTESTSGGDTATGGTSADPATGSDTTAGGGTPSDPGTGGSGSTSGGTSGDGAPADGSSTSGSGSGTTTDPLPMKEVFFDAFDDRNYSRWHFNGSWWKTTGGQLQAGPVSGWTELRAYVSGSHFADGRASFDATLQGGSGFGLFFHVSGDPINKKFDGYSFQFDKGFGSQGAFLIRKWVNGVELHPPIASAAPPAGYEWYGVPHHFEVVTAGSLMTVAIDGKTVLAATDGSFGSGGIGFRLWNQANARFDNVQVAAVSR